ncbi:unnamed protein product [Rotaria sp. Silwood1]|nr:unnamed protein product [Rotaria sp. Silwood1]CAF1688635.1 unnamed protein product [Rotaria sp. Silwood1]CAF3875675.1 unnamed protein product [Rotaria sp. Silwood1]CAF3934347.1 unnamed protein product [Rotaria sp. Silwood1]CAF4641553.1 unnamed protein product [Rotaria sp. Silwood1]
MDSSSSPSVNIDEADDLLDINLIIHMKSLISLMKQTLCSECNCLWDGSPSIKTRNGLYMHVEFVCSNCGCITHLYSSPQVRDGRRREINARLELGATLCGLGYHGIIKLLGALNLPPPTQQQKYSETQEVILNYVEKCQEQSMIAAVEEAIAETGGARELTVSGDGAWLTRGHTSVHGVSALCSTTKRPKFLDTTWSSKKCIKCQGSSGGMEKEMIHEMFCRSLAKYNTRYVSYVGDGDAKVHKYLVDNPPYPDIDIKKLEDTNHFAKRMLNRIMKIKRENKNKILSDGKRFSGKGRMTDGHVIKFKIYFAKAIRENKTDLNKLYQSSWAIFNHHYSTNEEPMHDWCDPKWCKYLQAESLGQSFSCSKISIPRACLDMIKPVFEELCSHTSLARVVDGGTQNANEAYHSLLWTMIPKHRYCSSKILRTGLGLSTIIFNEGYEALNKIFTSIFLSMGYYSTQCLRKLDVLRSSRTSKTKNKHLKRAKTTTTVAASTASTESDEFPYTPNEENYDSIVNDITLELNDIALELSDDDITDVYEAGGDD